MSVSVSLVTAAFRKDLLVLSTVFIYYLVFMTR